MPDVLDKRIYNRVISFIVPCYNSVEYMDNCICSLINLNSNDDDIEIIIVDDGSDKDNTLQKANAWKDKYPTIIKVIHQENGGHGQAVNTGLKNAQGLYFKVVDSDDCLDKQGTTPIMNYLRKQLKRMNEENRATDLVIGNFVYNKISNNKKYPVRYSNALPQNREFVWNDIKKFHSWQKLYMHSSIYRTELLRDIKLELPKHIFYVDGIFVTIPLPYVKTLYYIDTNMYIYYIGRPDQSVNEKIIMKRSDHLLKGIKIIIDNLNMEELKKSPKLEKYMYNHLSQMILVITIIHRTTNTQEMKIAQKQMWEYIKNRDYNLYRSIFKKVTSWLANVPGEFGRMLCIIGYAISKMIIPYTDD